MIPQNQWSGLPLAVLDLKEHLICQIKRAIIKPYMLTRTESSVARSAQRIPEENTRRRLAGILAADVVSYSRTMQQDEAGTLTLHCCAARRINIKWDFAMGPMSSGVTLGAQAATFNVPVARLGF
jgi:hypothetical protein